MNGPLLEVDNLSFSYEEGGEKTLQNVSFSVYPGQYVAIIGHNGSGKSTLAKLIMGLLGGYEGEIRLFGEKLDRKNLKSLRSRIGIVFQNPDNQFVGSTVADDIAFGLENRQVDPKQMDSIIREFASLSGMEDFLDREPSSLSGGQKQRVAISGVLAMSPEIVILDEATAMLDPKGKKEIAELIAKVKERMPSLTILSITHDIEEAGNSDEVLVLNEGRLILKGTPEEVFSSSSVLDSSRLDVPFAYALSEKLSNLGLNVKRTLKPDELLEELLCR